MTCVNGSTVSSTLILGDRLQTATANLASADRILPFADGGLRELTTDCVAATRQQTQATNDYLREAWN